MFSLFMRTTIFDNNVYRMQDCNAAQWLHFAGSLTSLQVQTDASYENLYLVVYYNILWDTKVGLWLLYRNWENCIFGTH